MAKRYPYHVGLDGGEPYPPGRINWPEHIESNGVMNNSHPLRMFLSGLTARDTRGLRAGEGFSLPAKTPGPYAHGAPMPPTENASLARAHGTHPMPLLDLDQCTMHSLSLHDLAAIPPVADGPTRCIADLARQLHRPYFTVNNAVTRIRDAGGWYTLLVWQRPAAARTSLNAGLKAARSLHIC